MYQVHDWAKVRELVREGVRKKRIAEQLGCSRTTVYRLAGLAEPPCYERRSAGSQLEPFKDAIADMLIEDDAAPATVIRERLQRRGYAGGVTILKDYLRELGLSTATATTSAPSTPRARSSRPTGGTPASTCRSARARAAAPTAS